MDFIDEVRAHSARFKTRIEHLDTEEATKTALVMPFVRMMGYDTEDPTVVVPEFTADVGAKKGEKVDYALMQDGKPIILVEAKKYDAPLKVDQESQLFRYFQATEARFAILTDGIVYKFYSDLEQPNIMDRTSFLEFNMVDFSDAQVAELKLFTKSTFSFKAAFDAAREMKYMNEIKRALASEMRAPTEDFVRFILRRIEYSGPRNRRAVEMFTPLVHRAFGQFANNFVDTRLKTALAQVDQANQEPEPAGTADEPVEIGDLYLNSRGVEARGWLSDDGGFTVRAGSTAVKQPVPSISERYAKLREAMREDGLFVDELHVYRLTRDTGFNSPSEACSVIVGMNYSGPHMWRDAEGRTLKDLLSKREQAGE